MKKQEEEGVQEVVDLLKEFDEINLKFGEELTDDEMNAVIARQAEVQDLLDNLQKSSPDLDASEIIFSASSILPI